MPILDVIFNWRQMDSAKHGQWIMARFRDESVAVIRVGTVDLSQALEWTPVMSGAFEDA